MGEKENASRRLWNWELPHVTRRMVVPASKVKWCDNEICPKLVLQSGKGEHNPPPPHPAASKWRGRWEMHMNRLLINCDWMMFYANAEVDWDTTSRAVFPNISSHKEKKKNIYIYSGSMQIVRAMKKRQRAFRVMNNTGPNSQVHPVPRSYFNLVHLGSIKA